MHEQVKNWLSVVPAMVLPYWQGEMVTEDKADGSPVTLLDKEIEHYLRECIKRDFPADGIIGEEFPPHQPESPRQWVIDPIDGTRAMIGGFATFTTLIALLEGDTPVFSAMLQPVTGELWWSIDNKTLFDNVIPAKAGIQSQLRLDALDSGLRRNDVSECRFATTSPFLFRSEDQPKILQLAAQAKSVMWGGDGYAYGKLASGRIDLIVESGMQPYDFLPLVPIIRGAGGIISDWQGLPLTRHSNGDVIACANQGLYEEVLQFLRIAA